MGSDAEDQIGLGESLQHAQRGAFFDWFHLQAAEENAELEQGRRSIQGLTWSRFRPAGESFARLVELELGLGLDNRIERASLGVDRAFIAPPAIQPYARDITKSFLNWILPVPALRELKPEIDSISQFCDGESRVLIVHDSVVPHPTRPPNPGAAADIFMGCAERWAGQIEDTRVVFEKYSGACASGRFVQWGVFTLHDAGEGRGRLVAHYGFWARLKAVAAHGLRALRHHSRGSALAIGSR
jgi:hypothetical protein